MSVKIRLTRMGKKKQPSYRVVVMDSRKPRDGKYIEQIGRYDPRQDPSLIEIDNERALDWLTKGAQPTERAQKLLEVSGAWTQFRVQRGDILTIDDTPAPAETPEPVVLDEIVAEPEPVLLDDIVAEPEPVLLDDIVVDEDAVAGEAVVVEEEVADFIAEPVVDAEEPTTEDVVIVDENEGSDEA